MDFRRVKHIARRFSQSGRRRRFLNFARTVALLSVLLGSMALIISLAVLEGFDTELRKQAINFRSHITITAFNNSVLKNYQENIEIMKEKIGGIKNVSPIIEREGLVRSEKYFEGIIIRGIKKEYDFSKIENNMTKNRMIFPSDTAKSVLIGKRLADKLEVKVGDKLILYTIERDQSRGLPSTHISRFTVSGIYSTGMAQYDDIYVFMPFKTARKFFRLPKNTITTYEVDVTNLDNIDIIAAKIEETLGYPHYARTVFDIHRSIFAWIELQKEPIPIVLGLISIVAVLNIITTLLITVVEKTGSIGILRALGMNNRNILSIFIYQGISIGTLGTLTGSAIGFLVCYIQQKFGIIKLEGDIYFLDTLPIEFSVWHFVIVISVSIALAFLATLIPSFIAVRISPLRAIRFK